MSEAARKAEANGEPTATVEFRGETFTVPLEYDDLSIDFTEALEDGRSVGVVRGALGPAQWRVVKAMNLKNRDLGELSDAIAEAMGFTDAGNSKASSD
jgi:hypothetical protein